MRTETPQICNCILGMPKCLRVYFFKQKRLFGIQLPFKMSQKFFKVEISQELTDKLIQAFRTNGEQN